MLSGLVRPAPDTRLCEVRPSTFTMTCRKDTLKEERFSPVDRRCDLIGGGGGKGSLGRSVHRWEERFLKGNRRLSDKRLRRATEGIVFPSTQTTTKIGSH